MEKIDGPALKSKILSLLRIKGPSIPIHLSREIGLNTLFTSAFLSELAGDKEVKISSMKVGGSPVYYIPGHEIQLERFYTYLSGKEKEAFTLLKDKKILDDRKQEPAIRVALRSLKDFAFSLFVNLPEGQRIFWRYLSTQEQDAKKLIEDMIDSEKPKIQEIKPIEIKEPEKQEITPEIKQEIKSEEKSPEEKHLILEIEKPKLRKPRIEPIFPASQEASHEIEGKKPKLKEKTPFAFKVSEIFNSENIEILEDIDIQKKEYSSIVRINSGIGKLRFLAVCKDKKKLSETDIILAMQKSQELKLPLLICSQSLDKKAEKFLESHSLVKFKQIKL